jgi:DNA topoisomerase-2
MSYRRIRAKHFMNSNFKEFSLADNVRSIPTLKDGLKPSQRKVIYGLGTRGESAKEIKVATLAEHVSGKTDYHHGGGSLVGAIVGLARSYPGTNNMNMLMPNGQFGSRLTKEAAAERYIYTEFSPHYRQIFRKDDDILLDEVKQFSDGDKIEPLNYFPLLPLALVNGSDGTGTGHRSFILQYHPEHVRDACLKVLTGKKLAMDTLIPWFKDFRGSVAKDEETGQIEVRGILEVVNTTTIIISELPVGFYLDEYKTFLYTLKDNGFIKDFDDDSKEAEFKFTVTCPRSTTAMQHEELMRKFKLIARDTEIFTLWNEDDTIERFDTPEDIVTRFVEWRLKWYEVRRVRLIEQTTEEVRLLNEKLRFILFYLSHVDEFKNKKKDELIKLLLDNDFTDYDELLRMQIWKLTHDEIEKLKKEIGDRAKFLDDLQDDTAQKMYERELKQFKYDPSLGNVENPVQPPPRKRK